MVNGLKKKNQEKNFMEWNENDNTTHKQTHTQGSNPYPPLGHIKSRHIRGTLHSKYLHL